MTEEILTGGRPGVVRRVENRVVRPAGPWAKTVHALLRHIREQGFEAAPEPIGFDDNGNEILTFLEGDVANRPADEFYSDDGVLAESARLLRNYHDATTTFEMPRDGQWMHPPREPVEVICHGDFAPYNAVFVDGLPVGIIDFDVAHPAPRLWDIAYALYRWVPMGDPALSGERRPLEEQVRRMAVFLTAYGLGNEARGDVIETMSARLQAMTDHMKSLADQGDEKFRADIARGDLALYLADIRWLNENAERILEALSGCD